jgi:uncharacterized membrane protein
MRDFLGRILLATTLAALATTPPAAAHEGHKKSPSPPASPAASASPAAAASGDAPATAPAAAVPAPAPEAVPPAEEKITLQNMPWNTALTGHLHNKIVHFPLALGLAAALILLAAPRWPAYEPTARILLIAGAAAAVAAYFTGQAQHEAFEDGMLEGMMRLHQKAGITTGILLVLGVVVTSLQATRRWRWLYAIVLLAVLSATGFLGGLLSHGPVG